MAFFFKDTEKLRTHPKSVLFVTTQLRQREIKMAFALKSQGWSVGLIFHNWTPFQPCEYFNYVWEVNSAKEAYTCAKKLAPRLIHVFSGAIDDYVMMFCRNKIAPVVIDLNDIFMPALMDYCPERYRPTREALSLADGFCARDLQLKCAEKIDHCELPPELIFFPEYCWNNRQILDQKKLTNDVHIVSVGTISLETYGMYDSCYLEIARRICGQEIHLHLYPPWSYRKDYRSNVNFEKDYAQFIELARHTPYLHIHNSLPVEQLARELPQYDFGIITGGCEEFGQWYSHCKPKYVESCYSGRISDFLDARLPVLINEEVAFNYWLLKRYGVCVDLKSNMQKGLKPMLQTIKQNVEMKTRLEKAVTKLSIVENAARLTEFYSHIMEVNAIKLRQPTLLMRLAKRLRAFNV